MDIFVGCPCLDGSFVQGGVLWMNCSISQFKVVLLCIGLSHAAWCLSTNTSALFCVSGSLMRLGTSLPTHLHCSVYRALSCSLVPLYQHICTVLCTFAVKLPSRHFHKLVSTTHTCAVVYSMPVYTVFTPNACNI